MKTLANVDFGLLRLWVVLILITVASLESVRLKGHVIDERLQGAAVIILAFIKVRLIILDFMEIRHAPVPLRVALEAWMGVICAALITLLFYTP